MKRRILLIEDDQADAMAFRRELQKQDSSVDLVVAREASEAMQLLTEGNIAQVGVSSFLVVVDQQLPGISGLDWIAGLRANSLLCGTPVVMLTGDSEGIPDRRARRLGLNLVLEKEDLHDAVEKILERLSRRTQDHAKLGEERSELRALLVDDDSVDRMQLRRVIERMRKEDWSLHEAERGEEALAYVQDLQPDLVFLDYALPDLDGVRILRELRVRMAMRLPRVVAVTGAGSEEVARRLFLLGVEDYLVKRSISSGSIYRLLDLASREIRSPRVREPRLEGARTPLVALSGSTGGMKVCRDVLAAMPANVPFAMLLILHLNRGEGQERLLDVLGPGDRTRAAMGGGWRSASSWPGLCRSTGIRHGSRPW
jgi:CheY-like chemotaxis protein